MAGDHGPVIIRQGCPLSPYLFIIVLSVLLHDVEEKLISQGLPLNTWSVGNPRYDLEHADDTLLISTPATKVSGDVGNRSR